MVRSWATAAATLPSALSALTHRDRIGSRLEQALTDGLPVLFELLARFLNVGDIPQAARRALEGVRLRVQASLLRLLQALGRPLAIQVNRLLGGGNRRVLSKVVKSRDGQVKVWVERGSDGRIKVMRSASPDEEVSCHPGAAAARQKGQEQAQHEEKTRQGRQRAPQASQSAATGRQLEALLQRIAEGPSCQACSANQAAGRCFRGSTPWRP